MKCLQCGYEFEFMGASEDNLGWHTTCPKCEGSFDIDIDEVFIDLMEKTKSLVDFIHDNWHWCPFKDESGIDFEKECVGFREAGCKECIYRNVEKLNCQ